METVKRTYTVTIASSASAGSTVDNENGDQVSTNGAINLEGAIGIAVDVPTSDNFTGNLTFETNEADSGSGWAPIYDDGTEISYTPGAEAHTNVVKAAIFAAKKYIRLASSSAQGSGRTIDVTLTYWLDGENLFRRS